jgi:hypothetical protein
VGFDDSLTPPHAVERTYDGTQAAYRPAAVEDNLSMVAAPGVGHVETVTMRDTVLALLSTTSANLAAADATERGARAENAWSHAAPIALALRSTPYDHRFDQVFVMPQSRFFIH